MKSSDVALKKIGEFNKFGSVLGLERIRELLHRLGEPQKDLKIIHIAGTNGKGSVSRFIYEILREAGYNTGIYSSPYLEVFNERIEFNGEYIDDDSLKKYADRASEEAKKMCDEGLLSPTEFDVVTAIGFMYFKEKNADFVILEVGLGGRGDSTNVIEKPLITAISSISYDHTDRLGTTIDKIAGEKAGIIKEGIPLVYATIPNGITEEESQVAKGVIEDKASQKKAQTIEVKASGYLIKEESLDGTVFDCTAYGKKYEDMRISLVGAHQVANAAVALTTVEVLRENGIINITDHMIYRGMENAKNKGRFEVLSKEPMYILDGAHNSAGMQSFVRTVSKLLSGKKLLITIGVLKDKEIDKMMQALAHIDADFIATNPNNPRKLDKEDMRKVLVANGKNVIFTGEPAETLDYVKNITNSECSKCDKSHKYDATIFVGSLYLIGEIRRLIGER